ISGSIWIIQKSLKLEQATENYCYFLREYTLGIGYVSWLHPTIERLKLSEQERSLRFLCRRK
ncbi:hypothetical protein, partial [Sphaerochaeta sp. S2]|uniref:hypothetical protein n=1 Tax=Sphaerochaeta sp. S2 TaxID=2798868 RepID=UPI001E5E895D